MDHRLFYWVLAFASNPSAMPVQITNTTKREIRIIFNFDTGQCKLTDDQVVGGFKKSNNTEFNQPDLTQVKIVEVAQSRFEFK